jgi:Short-chain dehydrogenases of various substrate specificities
MQELQGDRARRAFDGRRALVIGGSGGIGAAVSRELALRGAGLVVHGGSSDRLASLVDELQSAGTEAEALLMPLEASPAAIERLVQAVLDLGPLDILVLAYGPFLRKSLAETTAADWARLALLDLALPGALACALLPRMAERGWGRILLFGGTRTDGIRAYSSNAAYAAAKTGLSVLAKSLAAEGADRGVGSVLVCPGLVETEYLGAPERAALASRAPGGRLLSPAAVAAAAGGLIAAEPCVASGALVTLDAGLSF